MTSTLDHVKSQFETLIREGRFAQVRKQMKLISQSEIPRQERVTFANLARRSGMPRMAVSLLRPFVRSENSLEQPPTAQEVASYAMALATLGAVSEALSLSDLISESEVPEALLACAYIQIWRWDYAKAVPYLKRYIDCPGPTTYQIHVAKLNLAASYDYLGWSRRKKPIVDELIRVASREKWHLILRDTLILQAQEAIYQKDWITSKAALDQASQISHSQSLDSMIIQKWQIFMELETQSMNAESRSKLNDLKLSAAQSGRWEIIRDCDYFVAKATRNIEGVSRVYFGTPYPSFRNRIRRETSDYWQAPKSYVWMPTGESAPITVDLRSGKINGANDEGLPIDLRLRLLRILSSDSYRPFKIGSLFAELYPGKEYDSQTSPPQAFDVIKRLRSLIDEKNLGIEIQCWRNQYRLQTSSKINLVVYDESNQARPSNVKSESEHHLSGALDVLRKAWPHRSFSTREASQLLQCADRKARIMLSDAASKGLLYQSGSTQARLYRFRK